MLVVGFGSLLQDAGASSDSSGWAIVSAASTREPTLHADFSLLKVRR